MWCTIHYFSVLYIALVHIHSFDLTPLRPIHERGGHKRELGYEAVSTENTMGHTNFKTFCCLFIVQYHFCCIFAHRVGYSNVALGFLNVD